MKIATPMLLLTLTLLASACDSQPTPTPSATATPDTAAGATTPPESVAAAEPTGPMTITQWGPDKIKVGETFNLQPDGNSGMWFELSSAAPPVEFAGTVGGKPLLGVVANGKIVTATVPTDYLTTAGTYPVELTIPSTGVTIKVGDFVIE